MHSASLDMRSHAARHAIFTFLRMHSEAVHKGDSGKCRELTGGVVLHMAASIVYRIRKARYLPAYPLDLRLW